MKISDEAAVKRIVSALNLAGHKPKSVDHGDGDVVNVAFVDEAVAEVMSVDEAYYITSLGGWVRFVLGNGDPLDLVADHTLDLSAIIDPIMREWGL